MAFAVPAYAAYEGDTNADDTWRGTPDGTISVQGLSNGDQVKFYKVLAYDQDASTAVANLSDSSDVTKGAGGWKVIAPFATGTNAITGTDLQAILSTGISDALAGKIAKNATGSAKYSATAGTDGIATAGTTAAPVEAGLYVAIITPANANEIFNPVFVGADYYTTTGGDQSSTWTVDTDMSYSNTAMAKKAELTVTKEAAEASEAANESAGAKAVGKGDVVDFTVSTTIPEFADNYTAPLFVVSDSMTSGLAVVADSVKVYESDGTTEIPASVTVDSATKTQYTVTYTGNTQYKVVFDPAYLLGLNGAKQIKIKYSATVTEDAVENVNVEENTVTVEYSHEPSVTQEGNGKKIGDKTHHYSFTIDGNVWGDSQTKTTEVVKVGLDDNGNEITQTTEIVNGKKIGALAGAEFKLFTDAACTTEYNKGAYAAATATAAGNKIVSDSEGRLTLNGTTSGIPGLDAGTYYLKEMKAPDGYIKQQTATKIEIIPTYYGEVTWTENGVELKSDDILKSYIVKVNDVQTASYNVNYDMNAANTLPINDDAKQDTNNMATDLGNVTIGNNGPVTTTTSGQVTNTEGKIINTQGNELPSTGGMGTTILYIVGGVLVLLGAVFLITRRRMAKTDITEEE